MRILRAPQRHKNLKMEELYTMVFQLTGSIGGEISVLKEQRNQVASVT